MSPSPAYPEPTEVRHEKSARRLVITWDDGHASTYDIDYLRSWCPCAGCQGHDPVARYLDRHGEELVHLEAVGNYALAPTWKDGHNTGLFSWRLLRGLCPCDDCGGEKR
jgi:DUF971 family protein